MKNKPYTSGQVQALKYGHNVTRTYIDTTETLKGKQYNFVPNRSERRFGLQNNIIVTSRKITGRPLSHVQRVKRQNGDPHSFKLINHAYYRPWANS